ncbi:Uncharacterized protein DAT39_000549, partial [Clarias magur]
KVNVEMEVSESEDEESENETPEKHRQSSLTSIGLQSPDPQSRGIVSWQHIFKSSLFSIYRRMFTIGKGERESFKL